MKIRSRRFVCFLERVDRILYFSQITHIPLIFFLLIFSIVSISFLLLYSAGEGISPWCIRQFFHFLIGFMAMLIIAATPIRLWYSFSYVLYIIALMCLLLTTFLGVVGMGAQRWMSLAFIRFQPSELMRIALILALARQFNDRPLTQGLKPLFIPSLFVIIPVFITLEQPDLGTAILLLLGSGALFFFAGIRLRYFVFILIIFIISLPVLWQFLHDYQKNRVFTFLNPERDPLGSGYHIIQSKIAIGSGGFWGKGFMHGTQGSLDFLPEKHTDFIFTLLSEEFGFLGVLILLILYGWLILFNLLLSSHSKNAFCQLVITGMTLSFSLYIVINIAMVVGFLPVVGIPLPFVSYGGTSMVTLLISQGIILSAAFYKPKVRSIQLFFK